MQVVTLALAEGRRDLSLDESTLSNYEGRSRLALGLCIIILPCDIFKTLVHHCSTTIEK